MKKHLSLLFLSTLLTLSFTKTIVASDGPALQITTLEKQGGAFTKLQFKALRKNVTLRGFTLERSGDGKYYEYERAKVFYGKDYDVIGFTKVKSAFGFFGKGTGSPDKVEITFKDQIILPVNESREFEVQGIASKGNQISQTEVLTLVDTWTDAQEVFIDEPITIELSENEDTEHRLDIKTISPNRFTITSKNGATTLERIIFYNKKNKSIALKYFWNEKDVKTDFYTSSASSQLLNFPLAGRIYLAENESITMEMIPYSDLDGISMAHVVSDAKKGYVDDEYNPIMDKDYLAKNKMAAINPPTKKIKLQKEAPKGKYSEAKYEDRFDKAAQDLDKKEQEKKRKRHLIVTKKDKELPLPIDSESSDQFVEKKIEKEVKKVVNEVEKKQEKQAEHIAVEKIIEKIEAKKVEQKHFYN